MPSDALIRVGKQAFTFAAVVAFVAFLLLRHGLVFLLSLGLAVAAYAFFREDLRRNPVDLPTPRLGGAEDRVEDGSGVAVIPGVSMGGVHLSYETRSRWRGKR